jgi:hypothetical protein
MQKYLTARNGAAESRGKIFHTRITAKYVPDKKSHQRAYGREQKALRTRLATIPSILTILNSGGIKHEVLTGRKVHIPFQSLCSRPKVSTKPEESAYALISDLLKKDAKREQNVCKGLSVSIRKGRYHNPFFCLAKHLFFPEFHNVAYLRSTAASCPPIAMC